MERTVDGKVLITGGSGRMGRYVAAELGPTGCPIRVFDVKRPDYEGVEYVCGDLNKIEDVIAALDGIDAVIHLAAVPGETGEAGRIFGINVDGTFNVLEACARKGVNKVVFASSVCTYGVIRPSTKPKLQYLPIDEDTPLMSEYTYGTSKIIGERLCQTYSLRYGMKTTSLRIATVMFPESQIWKPCIDGLDNPEHQFMPGVPVSAIFWQYVHVKDVAQAFRLALESLSHQQEDFQAYNIGAADALCAVPSIDIIKAYFPELSYLKDPMGFADGKNAPLFGIAKARRFLGYRPRFSWQDLCR
ncbi:MAG TPA: NAD(P)-dependent oxidoreductase [Bacillota bacterium]|nr:NAD(P)-dependent oxidoreductase [Bacillota bacterium]